MKILPIILVGGMLLYCLRNRRGIPESPTPPTPTPPTTKAPPSDPFTVLVVESRREQRELLVLVLQRENYRVIFAEDGIEALDKLASDRVDIMLSDVTLPRMNGFDLVRIIRSNLRFRDLYFIFVTAKVFEADIAKGFELGADDYVLKPYSFKELMARVRVGKRVIQRLATR
jgi:Response regulators consisting of a CheY-like receiver domain and a winged-helix DNA-binding domain